MTNTDRLTNALADRYRLERQLGAGGMATVYLAADIKHDRKVAVKVLRPELAAVLGGDRFVQEIKTTAQLQHPHILPLFDSGEADGFLFYVMPYIEGETLRDKLNRETQLGIDEAVRITREVADALDYAHRQGVIHRDIKPENILLHDGRPVVADFGIALALSAAAGGRMTETGMSLGTPHYMSPEQATADKDITARTDVYSLASVLYEMLTGNPPHTGSSAQQIIMRIVAEEVAPVTTLRKSVPPNVTAAVAKALEKVPADRFASAKEFADALADPTFETVSRSRVSTRPRVHASTSSPIFAGIAVLALALAAWAWLRPAPAPTVTRFDITPRAGGVADAVSQLALSPDGSRVVYVGTGPDGTSQLMTRAFTELDPVPLPGTDGALMPAVSPDGETIAFMRDGTVMTMSLAGGPALSIGEGADPAWADDGTIYFARDQVIWRVGARGGSPEPVTTEVDGVQVMPQPLPGGRGLLLTVRRGVARFSRIAVVGPDGGAPREMFHGTMVRYAASGHIVYGTADGTLLAASFDLDGLEAGRPVPLVAGVEVLAPSHTLFALADNGTLVYRTAEVAGRLRELVWVDRAGRAAFIDSSLVGVSGSLNLGPDGATVVVSNQNDVLIKRLDATPGVRLTFDEEPAHPTWTPDGDSVTVNVGLALVTRRADGSGRTVQTVTDPRGPVAPTWASDRSWLVYRTNINMAGQGDILAVRPGVDSAPVPVVATPARELSPALSPDGRWLAYSSDEGGPDEIYVVPFPNSSDGRWAVSRGGGMTPRWSPNGRELFYVGPDSLVAVTFATAPTFAVRSSRALFSMQGYASGGLHPAWAVAPDGRRFLMSRAVEQPTSRQEPRLILVQHFFQELRDKVGR